MNLGQPNLKTFAKTLEKLAKIDSDIMVVTSDSRGSGKLVNFGEEYPEQIVEVGIAEQNLVGMSAGLASTGKKVFAVSPSCFLTARSLEQIKNDICYSDNPVNLIGISAGVSYGSLGSTHHSTHDLAVLRAINNINILVPADNFETEKSIEIAAESEEPFFIRFGKRPMYDLHDSKTKFRLGKGIQIKNGKDLAFVATGETVYPALKAAEKLEKEGISCSVVSMHSIKPFDKELLLEIASSCSAIVTVEEHGIYGGLGELCAAILMEEGINIPFKIVGIPDEYTVTGAQMEIFEHYGISEEGLAETALKIIRLRV
ncbi:transketolase family protein [Autumnicola musiva]|uniref:Transketolase C-terminal domain-containing protein n=1 Tax=Autumnicola musiva TaxID=3075589 RepID=A0ABU3D7X8_9FLAO|nr:transketolase C-terminal domain-containing protein [Zunongwangia sp. F117]MDT0677637.1 transketolase C-terminal domain-containing protein [Zunongwangia sp. F117]